MKNGYEGQDHAAPDVTLRFYKRFVLGKASGDRVLSGEQKGILHPALKTEVENPEEKRDIPARVLSVYLDVHVYTLGRWGIWSRLV